MPSNRLTKQPEEITRVAKPASHLCELMLSFRKLAEALRFKISSLLNLSKKAQPVLSRFEKSCLKQDHELLLKLPETVKTKLLNLFPASWCIDQEKLLARIRNEAELRSLIFQCLRIEKFILDSENPYLLLSAPLVNWPIPIREACFELARRYYQTRLLPPQDKIQLFTEQLLEALCNENR